MPDVTRRGFLKGLSALVGGVAVGSNLETPPAQPKPGPQPAITFAHDPDTGVFNDLAREGVLSVSEIPVHDHGQSRYAYASFHGIRLADFADRNPFS